MYFANYFKYIAIVLENIFYGKYNILTPFKTIVIIIQRGEAVMDFITLKELSNTFFNIVNPNVRAPIYTESSSYYPGNRSSTGIVYLKNCDMTTTSMITNIQYNFKKGSLVLFPEKSNYYSIFNNIDDSIPTFYCLNQQMYTSKSDKIYIGNEPSLIFENTPSQIKNHIEQGIPTNSSPAYIQAYFFTLWDLIFKNLYTKQNFSNKISNIINPANISNQKNIELAEQLNISVSTLTRIFKKHYNTTPAAYALKLKIENAKFHLINTNMSVSEIAQNLNFNSPEHFSRIFKKHTGLSPIKYRNTYIKK